MSNFAEDIVMAVYPDTVTAVKILSSNWTGYGDDPEDKFKAGNELAGQIISFEQALQVLDYEYDRGFGCMDCHDIVMWSADLIYYIHEYDGSTSIETLPRNPA